MKWEYKTIKLPTKGVLDFDFGIDEAGADEQLNSLGKLGWELVSVICASNSRKIVGLLKRTK
ncbi:MAG: DUF4177 domain-containing protein [Verrucomicrobia bacterium]|nr:DUF4177 domain-containing protein [Verrucomicrobiota bacterium]